MKYSLFLRNTLSYLLYYSGLINIFSHFNNKSIILGYHHVLPENDPRIKFIQPGMYVTTKTFELHLDYLTKHYNIIPLELLANNYDTKNSCIITFDDGWSDNYQYAYPVLKKYNVPATIFITTNMIDSNQWPWPDRISYYIHTASGEQISELFEIIDNSSHKKNRTIGENRLSSRNKLFISDHLISYIKNLDVNDIHSLMNSIDYYMSPLGKELNMQKSWLTWEEILDMSQNNISFGAHTHNHTILTNTSIDNTIEEINTSKKVLSNHLGKSVEMFCYPNGNYNEDIINILKDQGFKIATTTQSGSISQSKNLLTLPRFMIHQDMISNIPMFAYRISGLF